MSMRIRLFYKELQVNNFAAAEFKGDRVLPKKRTPRQLAQIIAEVYFTPRGWRVEAHQLTEHPIHTWDEKHTRKLYGVSDELPDGDMREMNFKTLRGGMQFITKRLKGLGWKPEDDWHH